MSHRFCTAVPAGVYRATRAAELVSAAEALGFRVARVILPQGATKAGLLRDIAVALDFPSWFGANWDALEDCLTDGAYLRRPGCLLLVEQADRLPPAELAQFVSILTDSARYWAERQVPFYAIFVPGSPELPDIQTAAAL